MVDDWLHSKGYTYLGENSCDRITLIELGWLLDADRYHLQQRHGIDQSTRKAAEIFEQRKADGKLH